MFKTITKILERFKKSEKEESKSTAKERLHLVLAQDRANISADFLEMMKQEILEVIKKYIDIDEKAIDVRLTNKEGEDGKVGAPALYANIPIITIKNEARKLEGTIKKEKDLKKEQKLEKKEDKINEEKNESNNEDKNTNNDDIEKNEDVQDVENLQENDEEKIEQTKQESENDNVDEVDNEKKDS